VCPTSLFLKSGWILSNPIVSDAYGRKLTQAHTPVAIMHLMIGCQSPLKQKMKTVLCLALWCFLRLILLFGEVYVSVASQVQVIVYFVPVLLMLHMRSQVSGLPVFW